VLPLPALDDAFFGANNPAAAAFAGNRLDLGAGRVQPQSVRPRRYGGLGPIDMSVESDSNYFLVPEFGYNRMINNDLALGLTVYGNGGMNTDYSGRTDQPVALAPLTCCAVNGDLGVDLMQLIVAPTVAFKIAPNHSVGISPLIGLPDASRHRACKLFGAFRQIRLLSPTTAMTMHGALASALATSARSPRP
jgi:long-chain fatty acid transport protein